MSINIRSFRDTQQCGYRNEQKISQNKLRIRLAIQICLYCKDKVSYRYCADNLTHVAVMLVKTRSFICPAFGNGHLHSTLLGNYQL